MEKTIHKTMHKTIDKGTSKARQKSWHRGARAIVGLLLSAVMVLGSLNGPALSTALARTQGPQAGTSAQAEIPPAETKAELKGLALVGGEFVRPAPFRGNRTVYWVRPTSGTLTITPTTFKAEDRVELKVNGIPSASWDIVLDSTMPMTQVEILLTAVVGDGAESAVKTRTYCLDVCAVDPTSHDVVQATYGTLPYPDTSNRLMPLADQIVGTAGFNYGAAEIAFFANNYAGSQKNTNNVNDPARAINPDWRALHYHLSIWNNLGAEIIIDNTWSLAEAVEVRALSIVHPGIFIYARNIETGNVEVVHDFAWNSELVNITDETYFEFLVRSLIYQCRSTGYDSVFLDSYNLDTIYSFTRNRYEGFRGTDLMNVSQPQLGGMTWADASEEFMARLTKELNRAGIWALPNMGNGITTWDPTDYAYSNGGMHEDAFIDPDTSAGLHDWKQSMSRYMYLAQKQKVTVFQFGVSKADSLRRMQKVAAYYLVKGEHSYINMLTADGQYAWYPEYDIDLGAPLKTVAVGKDTFSSAVDNAIDGYLEGDLYVRRFEKGIVIVNPNATYRTWTVPSGTSYFRAFALGGGLVSPAGVKQGSLDFFEVSGTITVAATGAVILVSNFSNAVTVRFVKNSDSILEPSFPSKKVTPSLPYGVLPGMYMPGYTFDGWYTEATGGDLVTATTIVTNTKDHDLYAHWTRNFRILTYDIMGAGGTAPRSQAFGPGALVTLSRGETVIPPAGYYLAGWNTAPDLSGDTYEPGASVVLYDDITLYAVYQPVTATLYTVGYDANGGSGTVPDPVTFEGSGSAIVAEGTSLSNPGFIFVGWTVATDGTGRVYLPGETITSVDFPAGTYAMTLHAVWTPIPTYHITYDIGDGTGSAPAEQPFLLGESVTIAGTDGFSPPLGHSFFAWHTDAGMLYAPGALVAFAGDFTLHAGYVPNTYTVIYNPNGADGTVPDTQTFTGASSVIVSEPSGLYKLPDYHFYLWNTKDDMSGDHYRPGNVINALNYGPGQYSIELYAIWEPTLYTITYDLTGCTGVELSNQFFLLGEPVTLHLGEGVIPPAGYRLAGWNTSPGNLGTHYDLGQTVTFSEDTTLYPFLEPITATLYTVGYDANGGSGTVPDPVTFEGSGSAIVAEGTSLSNPGFTFAGWTVATGGTGRVFMPGNTITSEDFPAGSYAMTLYAVWTPVTPVTYRVSYDIGTGTGTTPPDQSFLLGEPVILASGDGFTPPAGYRFAGWSTDPAEYLGKAYYNPGQSVVFPGNTTLYAVYEPISVNLYTLAYNANGGSGDLPDPVTFGDFGHAIVAEATSLSRTGFTFAVWNTAADRSGTDYVPGKEITATDFAGSHLMTLYAIWTPVPVYRVTYDILDGTGSAPGDQEFLLGESVTIAGPEGITPPLGYTFAAWYRSTDYLDSEICVPGTSVAFTGNTTLYARYLPNSYTVTYSPNGADGTAPATQTFSGSASVVVSDSAGLAKPGYRLLAWNTKADGTGKTYNPGTTISATDYMAGSLEIALHAQWGLKDLTVSFDKNAADAEEPWFASKTVRFGEAYGTLPTVTRPEYYFEGWHEVLPGSTRLITETSIVEATEDHTLLASWSKAYSVVYDLDGGTYKGSGRVDTFLVRFMDSNLLPGGTGFDASKMARKGYRFVAFDVSVGGSAMNVTNANTYASLVSGDDIMSITLKARWEKSDAPVTGDASRVLLWGASALCALGMAVFAWARTRKGILGLTRKD